MTTVVLASETLMGVSKDDIALGSIAVLTPILGVVMLGGDAYNALKGKGGSKALIITKICLDILALVGSVMLSVGFFITNPPLFFTGLAVWLTGSLRLGIYDSITP